MEPEAVTEAEAAVAPVVIAVAVSAAVEHVATFADAEFVGGDHLARLRVHEGADVHAVVLHHADVQDSKTGPYSRLICRRAERVCPP